MVTAAATASRPASGAGSLVWVIACAGLGLVLSIAVLVSFPTPSTRFDGAQFQIREGAGKAVGSALEITAPAPNGQVVVVAALPDIPAYRYASVRFRATGFEGANSPAVFWIARSAPRDAHPRPLSAEEVRTGQALLKGDDRWRGDMMTFGFVAQGPLSGPIRIEEVELAPGHLGWDDALGVLARNWTTLDGWSGGSVNFYVGAQRNERRLTPVVMVALWVGFTALLIGATGLLRTGLRTPRSSITAPMLGVLLVGWALLDIRWQADLLHRAGQTLDAKGQAPDAEEQKAFEQMRTWVKEPDARVIVVADDPISYAAHRARYHLLPLRTSFALDKLPGAAQARPGDYLVLLSYRGPIRYDAAAGVLATPESTLSVELLARSPAAGALFKIRQGS